jgi:hypothetical protein
MLTYGTTEEKTGSRGLNRGCDPGLPRKVFVIRKSPDVHYLERGKGAAVVFVHGTLGDYSVWEAQFGLIAQTYRAIA